MSGWGAVIGEVADNLFGHFKEEGSYRRQRKNWEKMYQRDVEYQEKFGKRKGAAMGVQLNEYAKTSQVHPSVLAGGTANYGNAHAITGQTQSGSRQTDFYGAIQRARMSNQEIKESESRIALNQARESELRRVTGSEGQSEDLADASQVISANKPITSELSKKGNGIGIGKTSSGKQKVIEINKAVADAETFEQRYSDIGSNVMAPVVAGADARKWLDKNWHWLRRWPKAAMNKLIRKVAKQYSKQHRNKNHRSKSK